MPEILPDAFQCPTERQEGGGGGPLPMVAAPLGPASVTLAPPCSLALPANSGQSLLTSQAPTPFQQQQQQAPPSGFIGQQVPLPPRRSQGGVDPIPMSSTAMELWRGDSCESGLLLASSLEGHRYLLFLISLLLQALSLLVVAIYSYNYFFNSHYMDLVFFFKSVWNDCDSFTFLFQILRLFPWHGDRLGPENQAKNSGNCESQFPAYSSVNIKNWRLRIVCVTSQVTCKLVLIIMKGVTCDLSKTCNLLRGTNVFTL